MALPARYLRVEVGDGHEVAAAAGAHRQLLPVPLVRFGAVHRVRGRPAIPQVWLLTQGILFLCNIKQVIESNESKEGHCEK